MVTGWNEPALTGVYKIVAKDRGGGWEPCIKISNQAEKMTNPGIKNVMRFYNGSGQMLADLLYLEEEEGELEERASERRPLRFNHPSTDYAHFTLSDYASVKKLLAPVMKDGEIIGGDPSLGDIQQYCRKEIEVLDKTYRRLLNPHIYKISLSDTLKTSRQT